MPDQPTIEHGVRTWDAQAEGMAPVSGFEVWASVTFRSGRKTLPVRIALCDDKDTADEIVELLRQKYATGSES